MLTVIVNTSWIRRILKPWLTSSRRLHTSEKLESGKAAPAKQSLGINCIPSNYTTSRKLPMVPGLKMDSMGIGPHWSFLHWSSLYRLLWHISALSLRFWLQKMMVWGNHHKKKSLFNISKYESVRGRDDTIQCPTTLLLECTTGIEASGERLGVTNKTTCVTSWLSILHTERNSVSVGLVP